MTVVHTKDVIQEEEDQNQINSKMNISMSNPTKVAFFMHYAESST
jgi:hypothetical protein